MVKIHESCSPVNARTQLASALMVAEASLRRSIGLPLTELLIAIVQHVVDRAYHRRRKWLLRKPTNSILHRLVHDYYRK